MEFPTNLLSIFAKHNGSMNPADGVLEVPRALLPTVEICEPIKRCELGTISRVETSMITSSDDTVANGSVDANLVILAPGLWDIRGEASFIADYTDLAERNHIYFGLENTGLVANGATFWSFLNVPQFQRFHLRLSVEHPDGFGIYRELTANGVGETKRLSTVLYLNRLG